MEMVLSGGQMVHIIQENGNLIKPQEMESFTMLTAISTTDNGKMINPMVLENTNIQMELFIKVNGKMINKTVEGCKSGQMDKNMKASLTWELNLEREF